MSVVPHEEKASANEAKAPAVTSLEGVRTGRYVVTTRNGTRHLVDLDAATSVRMGAPGREWTPATNFGAGPAVVGDGEPFHFTSISGAVVGGSMRLESDMLWRQTSTIRSIELASDIGL
jgi:hypothetical protein